MVFLPSCCQEACIPVVNTVLDKCLYGDKVVVSKVLDSGSNGEYPPKSEPDAVLREIVSSDYAVSHFTACKGEWEVKPRHVRYVYENA